MAIIYSYPKNADILGTDLLIGTTTSLVNGKPRNQTKNFSITDIANFVNSGTTKGSLTASSDTNITLTLGGTPVDSLFNNVSIAVGWTGLLADNRIASASLWNAAYNDKINSASVTGTGTKTLTLTQQDGGTITASWTESGGGISLTTIGTSGPATLVGSVLNIPDYTSTGGIQSITASNSTFVNLAKTGTSTDPILTASLSATGTTDSTTFLRGDNTWAVPATYSWNISNGSGAASVPNGGTVTVRGTLNQVDVSQSGRTLTVGLPTNVTVNGTLTVSGTSQSSFGGQVTIPTTPVAGTDAASKAYVDSSVTGALVFQGGYDAATNTPNLDSPPTVTINKGFLWTVTADGTFFTEQVRIGDTLIANVNSPTTLADWTTVQGNTDLATLSTVGLGNVNAGTGITVSYSNGTATVSTTATVESYATTISNTDTVTHNLNTKDVIVELYDTVTFDTIYADVSRPTVNTVTVTFAAAPTNPIRVLVQK